MCETNDNLQKAMVPRLKGKPKYKDAPRYPMIYKYEGEMKSNYSKSVKVMSTELAVTMMKFVKEK
jgi:hypothetical protein